MSYPSRIVCLTEETVETLYLLGREELIVGVSKYVERPAKAKGRHPVVTEFIRADVERILAVKPDLVIGFSDLQKTIAAELIERGLNVLITNQRSLEEILTQILFLSTLVGERAKGERLVEEFRRALPVPPLGPRIKVYFEEWDQPRMSCIRWVSDLIMALGGENIFSHKTGALAAERKVSDEEIVALNPDVIIGCWCGKKVRLESFAQRPGYSTISAVRKQQVYEVDPAIFLQPGPALFLDGIRQLSEVFQQVRSTLDAP